EGAEPIPGFDQAAIDGFAVRSVDIRQALESSRRQPAAPSDTEEELPREAQSARPVLPIVGEVTAGSHRPVRLQPRQAVRVHTGAP
ncbi:molybdopterin molybdenumtransferase, partial [Salinarimonas soli]